MPRNLMLNKNARLSQNEQIITKWNRLKNKLKISVRSNFTTLWINFMDSNIKTIFYVHTCTVYLLTVIIICWFECLRFFIVLLTGETPAAIVVEFDLIFCTLLENGSEIAIDLEVPELGRLVTHRAHPRWFAMEEVGCTGRGLVYKHLTDRVCVL